MKEIPTYKNLCELIEELKILRAKCHHKQTEYFPIQPVCVGEKIGFVNWATYRLECVPLFDEYDRTFISYQDNVCVRQGDNWGVISAFFRLELPISHSYEIAKQVCKELNLHDSKSKIVRNYGSYLRLA